MSIIKLLHQISSIKIGSFTLKSGDISPFYLDLRLIPSHPALFDLVIDEYCKLINSLDYKPVAVAGIMSAGVPFATGIAIREGIPLLQIRSEAKAHGTGKIIEGILPEKGSKVVLIDDLISTGASKINPKDALQSKGLLVEDLIVLIDRTNAQTKDILETNNLKLHATYTLEHLMTELMRIDIPEDELSIIKNAVKDWK